MQQSCALLHCNAMTAWRRLTINLGACACRLITAQLIASPLSPLMSHQLACCCSTGDQLSCLFWSGHAAWLPDQAFATRSASSALHMQKACSLHNSVLQLRPQTDTMTLKVRVQFLLFACGHIALLFVALPVSFKRLLTLSCMSQRKTACLTML